MGGEGARQGGRGGGRGVCSMTARPGARPCPCKDLPGPGVPCRARDTGQGVPPQGPGLGAASEAGVLCAAVSMCDEGCGGWVWGLGPPEQPDPACQPAVAHVSLLARAAEARSAASQLEQPASQPGRRDLWGGPGVCVPQPGGRRPGLRPSWSQVGAPGQHLEGASSAAPVVASWIRCCIPPEPSEAEPRLHIHGPQEGCQQSSASSATAGASSALPARQLQVPAQHIRSGTPAPHPWPTKTCSAGSC